MSDPTLGLTREYQDRLKRLIETDGTISMLRKRAIAAKGRIVKIKRSINETERAIRAREIVLQARVAEGIKRILMKRKFHGNKTHRRSLLRAPETGERAND